MKHKILFGYTFYYILTFTIPILFSFFIGTSLPATKTFVLNKDKQSPSSSMVISVMDHETKKITNKDIEEYLIGVVCAEMPASYESESLKAQAVAARSYIISKMDRVNPLHPDAIVCNNSAHCKAYIGIDETKEKWGDDWIEEYYPKVKSAVEDTRGECLVYEGQAVEAFFFALSNGQTESAGEVWGSDLPYLKSTNSEGDLASPDFLSYAEFSVSDFNSRLKNLSSIFEPNDTINIGKIVHTQGGRIKTIDINGVSFSGTDIRSTFSLNSADFTIEQKGSKITFTVEGKGHGVGMSQYGANFLAKKGFSYKDILNHYYSGVEIINKF